MSPRLISLQKNDEQLTAEHFRSYVIVVEIENVTFYVVIGFI